MNSTNTLPAFTSATQAKERLYSQVAGSLGRMSRGITHTADLCEQLQVDLQAMKAFSGLDAAKFMAIAALLVPDQEDGEEVNKKKHLWGSASHRWRLIHEVRAFPNQPILTDL